MAQRNAESTERGSAAGKSPVAEVVDAHVAESRAERLFPTVGDIAMMLLLFFLSQGVTGVLFAAFGFAIPDLPDVRDGVEEFMAAQVLRGERIAVIYPVSMLVSLLSIYLYVRLRGGRWRVARFSASGFNPNIILSGIVWIVAAQIVLEPIMALLPSVDNAGVGRGFWACVTAMVFAPVCEEMLCRGIILETLRRRWGKAVAVAVSALFFGIVHVEPATALAGVVVGTIFGMIYLRTSSLFSTIILHSINNSIALALICLDMDKVPVRDMIGNDIAYYAVYNVACVLVLLFFVETSRKVFRNKQ